MFTIIEIFLVEVAFFINRVQGYLGNYYIDMLETMAEYTGDKLQDFCRFALAHESGEDCEIVSSE
jgi:hypothetical protein